MPSRTTTHAPPPRGLSHANTVAPLAGRKRAAAADTSEASKRHAAEVRVRAQENTYRSPSELYERSCVHFQKLSQTQREALYDLWLPQDEDSENAIFMLENPDQQPPYTLSYEAIVNSVSMVTYMLPVNQEGQQRDPDFENAIANFYKQNHFEVDVSLLGKFRSAFAGIEGIEGPADRYVREITVVVPVYPRNQTQHVYNKLDWISPSNDRTASYLKTLVSSLSQLKHFELLETVVIKFKGPGAEDGSDIQFQGFVTQLATCIRELDQTLKASPRIIKEHSPCARCPFGDIHCEPMDLSHWFEEPTEEAIKNYERGAATIDEAMQIHLSERI